MSQQNVFARNFLLKMKIQLKFFSTISQHKHMTYWTFFPNTMVYACSITTNNIGTNRWYYELWYVL